MNSRLRIEYARTRDALLISRMSRELIEGGLDWRWRQQRVIRAIKDRNTVVIKALVDSRFAGFAIMRLGWDEAHLDLIAVNPEFRRLGVGRTLLTWLEESVLTAGVPIIRLEIRESNRRAMQFYERKKYRQVRRKPRYYCGREAAIELARDLWCDVSIGAT